MSTKKIETLVDDIYELLRKEGHVVSKEAQEALGKDIANTIVNSLFSSREAGPVLRFSSLGKKCDKQLWLHNKEPQEKEDLAPEAKIKYLYGHILEHLLLFLAKEAGHEVTGEQDTFEINGVVGHRDAVIDGVTVDAKSASTRGFEKFKYHKLETDDPFGYLDQINAYRFADKTLKDDRVAFLAIDKQFGHICLDIYPSNGVDYSSFIDSKKNMLKGDVPKRAFLPEPDGKSGNLKLGVQCSYCDVKNACYPKLRTFLYSSGPRFLTHVAREPDVVEVQK